MENHGCWRLRPKNYFFWNIEPDVGPGCTNNIEDVYLVQLAYASMAQNPVIDAAERNKTTTAPTALISI